MEWNETKRMLLSAAGDWRVVLRWTSIYEEFEPSDCFGLCIPQPFYPSLLRRTALSCYKMASSDSDHNVKGIAEVKEELNHGRGLTVTNVRAMILPWNILLTIVATKLP